MTDQTKTPRKVEDIVVELAWLKDGFKDEWRGHKLIEEAQDKLFELEKENANLRERLEEVREAGYAYRNQCRKEVTRAVKAEAERDAAIRALKENK